MFRGVDLTTWLKDDCSPGLRKRNVTAVKVKSSGRRFSFLSLGYFISNEYNYGKCVDYCTKHFFFGEMREKRFKIIERHVYKL